jgi:hypothetical protein
MYKCARFRIDIFKLCESNSRYCVNSKICTGDDLVEGSDKRASENIVPESVEPVQGKGCALHVDNWCSYPMLYVELHERRANALIPSCFMAYRSEHCVAQFSLANLNGLSLALRVAI